MSAAIRVEALKLSRSLVGVVATSAIIVGMIALLGGITAGVAAGNPELIAQAGPAAALDWTGLIHGAMQVGAVATILGFGTVLSWMFGREFTDGTIVGLFALPISRGCIALAKVVVYAIWASAVSAVVVCGVLGLGLLFGYGHPDGDTWVSLGRLWSLGVLSACVAVPVAWIATAARSVLAAIGVTIGLVATAQISALAGAGGWMPLAAPAIWAISNGTAVTSTQLAVTVVFALVFVLLTHRAWARLQLDR